MTRWNTKGSKTFLSEKAAYIERCLEEHALKTFIVSRWLHHALETFRNS